MKRGGESNAGGRWGSALKLALQEVSGWKAVVLAVAVAVTGCMDPHILGTKDADHSTAAKNAAVTRPPVVLPEDVNDGNARAKAGALRAEMDYDAHHDEVKTTPH
jgi:hypothetical protein